MIDFRDTIKKTFNNAKLKMLKYSACLRLFTSLISKVSNFTEWNSFFEMLVRYTSIAEVFPKLEIIEIDDLIPN